MRDVVVVGSGPSGVHFALTLLEKGYRVHMLDVGRSGEEPPEPEMPMERLKAELDDPVSFFLGENFGSLTLPNSEDEYYGFPPSKDFVFDGSVGSELRGDGFSPLVSYARGGLARAWTASVYPFNDHDLTRFPFSHSELAPYYAAAAERIGVTGHEDDLARFIPLHPGLEEPLRLDSHSRHLLETYERKSGDLNESLGFFAGRARLAVLGRDRVERRGCEYLGRCLWGCPTGALYTPEHTLEKCLRHDAFRYTDGHFVEYFECGDAGGVSSVVATRIEDGSRSEFPADRLALAAGTLSTSRIFLESLHRNFDRLPRLEGLMDNRQVLLPFVNLRRLGESFEPEEYQYHQLAVGLEADRPEEYVHGLLTTLTTGMAHPVVESIPLATRSAIGAFRDLRTALGILNVNFHDRRRRECYVELSPDHGNDRAPVEVRYRPRDGEGERLRSVRRRIRRAMLKLGCVVPPGTAHVRPMGASVHYAGTLPMSEEVAPLTASPGCQSHDVPNLYLVDGTTFPFLPAKNITFTLMANAIRVAEDEF